MLRSNLRLPRWPSLRTSRVRSVGGRKQVSPVRRDLAEVDGSRAPRGEALCRQGEPDMGDKGKRDKGKREQQKKPKLTPQEKRKEKQEKKNNQLSGGK